MPKPSLTSVWSMSTPGTLSRMMFWSARGCAATTSVTMTPSVGGMIGSNVFCEGLNIQTL